MPLDAKFWDPCIALSSRMRDTVVLFERELARRNGHMMILGPSGFVGMMEQDPESI